MKTYPTTNEMTLRDYLAARCLDSVMSTKKDVKEWQPEVARLAYRLADEMLIARELSTEELWPAK